MDIARSMRMHAIQQLGAQYGFTPMPFGHTPLTIDAVQRGSLHTMAARELVTIDTSWKAAAVVQVAPGEFARDVANIAELAAQRVPRFANLNAHGAQSAAREMREAFDRFLTPDLFARANHNPSVAVTLVTAAYYSAVMLLAQDDAYEACEKVKFAERVLLVAREQYCPSRERGPFEGAHLALLELQADLCMLLDHYPYGAYTVLSRVSSELLENGSGDKAVAALARSLLTKAQVVS